LILRCIANNIFVGCLTGNKQLNLQYKQWDDRITRQYGVVVEGWLLVKFQKPSDCKNKVELEKLLKAVTSGECKLCKMGNEEWNKWKWRHIAWNSITGDSEDNNSHPKALGEQAFSSLALPYSSPGVSGHLELFQSTPLTSPVPTSQPSNNIQEYARARADYTSNLHHLLNTTPTSDVEAHGASTQALEGLTGTHTSQTAACNSDSDAWGHNMSLTQFLHAPLPDSVIMGTTSSF